jgi:RNA polymerase sigma factor (sigma-70 family)
MSSRFRKSSENPPIRQKHGVKRLKTDFCELAYRQAAQSFFSFQERNPTLMYSRIALFLPFGVGFDNLYDACMDGGIHATYSLARKKINNPVSFYRRVFDNAMIDAIRRVFRRRMHERNELDISRSRVTLLRTKALIGKQAGKRLPSSSPFELLLDKRPPLLDDLVAKELRQRFPDAFARLTPREQFLACCRFGIGMRRMTLVETARALDTGMRKASELEKAMLAKLRRLLQ